VVEFGSDQQGAGMLGGRLRRDDQYTATRSCRMTPAIEGGWQARFPRSGQRRKRRSRKSEFSSPEFPRPAPNKANAIEFMKWFVTPEIPGQAGRRRAPFRSSEGPSRFPPAGNRLIPVTLAQFDSGAMPRPRTPDWAKVEELVGIQLNKCAAGRVREAAPRSTSPRARSRTI